MASETDNGLMTFAVSAGEHQVETEFTDTPLRRASKIISVFTLLTTIVYLKRKKHEV
jgi:uncharacterized membrane protein YfhO